MIDLSVFSPRELLEISGRTLEELQHRGILRSSNGPAGDYAEWLFCKAFGWERQPQSVKSFDALDSENRKIQIKGCRLAKPGSARQLSALRSLDTEGFDMLAVAIFDPYYDVTEAALVPFDVVRNRATRQDYVAAWKMMMPKVVWTLPGVQDVTRQLKDAQGPS